MKKNSKNILVVENNKKSMQDIQRKFHASDINVVTATHSKEAFAKLFLYSDQLMDLLWLNLHLPKNTSLQLLETVKQEDRLSNLMLIGIAENQGVPIVQKVKKIGVHHLIYKADHELGDIAHFVMGLLG